MRNLEVLVDGQWRADLEFGASFETDLTPGEHEVLITNKLKKQELLSALRDIKPALNSAKPGPADQAGARARWVQTQTNLCRAIQRDCL